MLIKPVKSFADMVKNLALNNLSFGSKIKFVGEGDFIRHYMDARIDKTGKAEYPWDIGDTVCFKDKAFTEGVQDCSSGGINNTERVSLFHYNPGRVAGFIDRIKDQLETQIEKLRASGKPLSGLIVGGKPDNDMSRCVFDDLKEVFSDMKLQPTILWGQSNWGSSDVFYSSKDGEDTWYIRANVKNDCRDRSYDVTSPEKLRKAFKCIKISDNDEVYIADRKIDKKIIEQDFLDYED